MENKSLAFTEHFFLRLNMHVARIPWDTPCGSDELDMGLRKNIFGEGAEVRLNAGTLKADLPGDHVFSIAEDRFRCRYLFIPVPGGEGPGIKNAGHYPNTPAAQEPPEIMKAGPYLNAPVTREALEAMFGEKVLAPDFMLFLTQYYSTLPLFPNDNFLEDYLHVLADQLYGAEGFSVDFISQRRAQGGDFSGHPSTDQSPDLMARMARRYELEDRLMDAVAHGDPEEAVRCMTNPVFSNPDIRTSVPLRSIMNYAIILNTLCRKAAQRGGVHPIYLDEISRRYAIRIEGASGISQVNAVRREMVRSYALLVQSRSTGGYSPVIQDVINYIHMHYTDSGLTLAVLASLFNINKSYLSALFKKETGETLTAFINGCRIDQAVFLLNTSSASMQGIAAACGIPDLAYFSRMFKRAKGMAPSEYRKMVAGG